MRMKGAWCSAGQTGDTQETADSSASEGDSVSTLFMVGVA